MRSLTWANTSASLGIVLKTGRARQAFFYVRIPVIWQIAWNTPSFKNVRLVSGTYTLLFFFIINESVRTSFTGLVFVIPVFRSHTANTNAIWKIWTACGTYASATCILVYKGIGAPLALFSLGVPKVRFFALYASAVVLIWTVQWTYTFQDLGIEYKRGSTLLTLFGLIVPEKWFIACQTDLISFIWSINRTCAFIERYIINVRQRTGIAWFCLLVPEVWWFTVNTCVVHIQVRCLFRTRASSFSLVVFKSWWTQLASACGRVKVWPCWTGSAFVAVPQWSIVRAVNAWFSAWIKIRILFAAFAFPCLSTPVSGQVTGHAICSCTIWQVWRTDTLSVKSIECNIRIVILEYGTWVC